MKKEHRRLILFFLLSAAVLGFVMQRTFTAETVSAVTGMSGSALLLIFFIWIIDYFSDSSALWFLAKESPEGTLSLWSSFLISGLRAFFNSTTPFNSGGMPAVVYALGKHGIPYGEGISISLVKLLGVSAWYFFFSFISTVMLFSRSLHTQSMLFLTIGILVLLAAAFYIFMFISLIHAKPLIIISGLIDSAGRRTRLIKKEHTRKKILHEAYIARRSIKEYFTRKKGLFLLAMCANFTAAASQIMLMVIILHALGIGSENFIDLFIRSSLLIFLIRFMPTPGGAGLGEGLYLLLFADIVPLHLLGAAVVIWRFFLTYTKAGIGAAAFSAVYSR